MLLEHRASSRVYRVQPDRSRGSAGVLGKTGASLRHPDRWAFTNGGTGR
ncbi:hypothetical protein [Alkalinema sp. FACHB-956]|nr:hypothetical protein [Alkalinema sp. FACHB-956]MBD2329705.1 hypothetical protein [Alkalinema sp. FACHB-956]